MTVTAQCAHAVVATVHVQGRPVLAEGLCLGEADGCEWLVSVGCAAEELEPLLWRDALSLYLNLSRVSADVKKDDFGQCEQRLWEARDGWHRGCTCVWARHTFHCSVTRMIGMSSPSCTCEGEAHTHTHAHTYTSV